MSNVSPTDHPKSQIFSSSLSVTSMFSGYKIRSQLISNKFAMLYLEITMDDIF